MHLRDAMIDDSGRVYGEGRMSFTPDPAAVFKLSDFNLIHVAVDILGSVRLVPCSAQRDPITGYLVPGPADLTMVLPADLSQVLLSALSADTSADPVTSTLNAGGWLAPDSGESATRQGLSDWLMSTDQVGEWITVRLSAALRSPKSRSRYRYWQHEDHWPVDDEISPRIEVEFRLDVMTAVVRFGGYSDALESPYEKNPAPIVRTSASAMHLESTPLGYNGSVFGIRRDGLWVQVFESKRKLRRQISIWTLRDIIRNARGLMDAASGGFSVDFYGIDLEVVAAHLRIRNVFGVTFTEGEIGRVTWRDAGSEGSETSKIVESKLRFELTLAGLELRYSVLPTTPIWGAFDQPYISGSSDVDLLGNPLPWPPSEEHRFQGMVTVPWEVLIVRSPLFVGHREKLLAARQPKSVR